MRIKKIILFVTLFVLSLTASIYVKANNGNIYKTYTSDASGNFIPTQDAYIAVKTIKEIPLTNSSLHTIKDADDIYFNETLKQFYIADRGNHRVVVASADFSTGFEVGSEILKKPQGVFSSPDGKIYVADYDLKQVVIFDPADFTTPTYIGKPTHPLYTESSAEFLPLKIVVDPVGTMYIVDSGNANGLVTITKDGEFSGYFGANYVKPSFSFVVKFLFATKEQKKQMYVSPISPTNLAIDEEGLINTISSIKGSAVKRLNIAGTNLMTNLSWDTTEFVDIAISPTGTIYCITKYGGISEYDREGNELFYFGGHDTTNTWIGLSRSPSSIEVDDEHSLYVLDGTMVQVYVQTEFASLVHEALALYNEGKYEESRVPWQKVLQMNNMFDLAHRGLGNAYLREMNYQEALKEFKLAKDTAAYSNAYWEVRNAWLNRYGYGLIIGLVALIIIIFVLAKVHVLDKAKAKLAVLRDKIYKVKIIEEVCYVGHFIRHPLDGFYEIKFHNKMSMASATILYIWFFILTLLGSFFTGFVFNTQDTQTLTVINLLLQSVIPVLLFVLCNYLISSITDGSGRFRDVYIGTICSLAPVLLFMPIVIILSNFIVASEAFLYTMPKLVLWGWSFGLMFFMIKDIEELQVGENIKNIVLTILTMLLFIAFAFLAYILGKQLVTFIINLIGEVFSRG